MTLPAQIKNKKPCKTPSTNPNRSKHSQTKTLDLPLIKPKRQPLPFITVVVSHQQHRQQPGRLLFGKPHKH